MEEINIVSELIKIAPAVGILGYWVFSLKAELKAEKEENKQNTIDYKTMAENAIKIITLADDKLSKDQGNNEKVTDIHRMVAETLEIVKKHIFKAGD